MSAALTEALSDSTVCSIGMETELSKSLATFLPIPPPSLPTIKAIGPVHSAVHSELGALPSSPISVKPASFKSFRPCSVLCTRITGIMPAVPAETLNTVALTGTCCCVGMIMADIPAAVAERIIALNCRYYPIVEQLSLDPP